MNPVSDKAVRWSSKVTALLSPRGDGPSRAWAALIGCLIAGLAVAGLLYRPEVAQSVGAAALVALAGSADRQPMVTILSPVDKSIVSTHEVEVKLTVQLPPGTSLLGFRALIDGRLATRSRDDAMATKPAPGKGPRTTYALTVPFPGRDCVLSVLAETSPVKAAPVSVRLRGRRIASTPQQIISLQPKLYVLAIGVGQYPQPDLRLRFAAKDARDLTTVLNGQNRALYRAVETRLLTDWQATKNNILDGLEWLQKQTTDKDVAVLFLAGHGITDPSTGSYYFLPVDSDISAMKRTMLPESEIRDTLAAIPGKVLLFLDSCHAGKVFAATQTRGSAGLAGFISELSSTENGVVVFAASTGRQSSQEDPAWNNGAFTKALVEGLSGRADYQKTGRITLNMLDLYLSERVKELTRGTQTPTTAKPATIPDFPIAMVRDITNDDVEVAR